MYLLKVPRIEQQLYNKIVMTPDPENGAWVMIYRENSYWGESLEHWLLLASRLLDSCHLLLLRTWRYLYVVKDDL